MRHRTTAAMLASIACAALTTTALAAPISYQGQLQDNGSNVNGSINFEFRLFTASSGGSQVGSTVFTTEAVADGVFTAELDFGLNPYTSEQDLWLEVVANGEVLPRQRVTAAPFSNATRGLQVSANGAVGIGVAAPPSQWLEVKSPSAQKGFRTFNFSGPLTAGLFNEGSLDGATVRINGLPTNDFWDFGQAADNSFFFRNGPGFPTTLSIGPADFNTVGRVGVGIDNPGAKFQVDTDQSDDAFRLSRDNGATELLNVGANGAVRFTDIQHRFGGPTGFSNVLLNLSAENWDFGLNITGGDAGKPGGGSWANTSDVRLKKDIRDLDGALDTLLALRGVTYEYKDPEAIGELDGVRTGFIAQEVEDVIPDWVWTAADGYKRVTIRGFEAMTVEALRELKSENDELRSRIAALESAAGTTVMTSSLGLPLLGVLGLGAFVAARRRTA